MDLQLTINLATNGLTLKELQFILICRMMKRKKFKYFNKFKAYGLRESIRKYVYELSLSEMKHRMGGWVGGGCNQISVMINFYSLVNFII